MTATDLAIATEGNKAPSPGLIPWPYLDACITLSCNDPSMGCTSMPSNALVQARIDPATRDEAAVVLASMGMTVSGAVRLLLTRIATEKALPFEPLVPNETTIAAMRDARAGTGMRRVGSVAELMATLNDDEA